VTSGPGLILASTSRYRQELLGRLRLPFEALAPGVDEASRPGEPPQARAQRLSLAKAEAVAQGHPGAVVIGADQVASCAGRILDKPGDAATARAQLAAQSGREVHFYSAVAVLCRHTGFSARFVDLTTVKLQPRRAPISRPISPTTVPGACAASGWGSRCASASTATIRPG
jgi:septum formation protein